MNKSLVSFYNDNNCIPVNQKGTLNDRVFARDYLYNSLGLNSLALSNLDVCEVGPGTGQNAVDLSIRGIKELFLIEPSQAGQAICTKLREERKFNCPVTIFSGTTENFNQQNTTRKSFDLVITEGLVGSSGYDEPLQLFDSIATLVKPKGFLMVGCEDDTGWFPEMLRRFISLILCKQNYVQILDHIDDCVALLKPYLISSHESLNFKTIRLSSDIIVDNILSPVLDKPFLGPLKIINSRPSMKYVASSPLYSVTPTYYKEAAADSSFASSEFKYDYIRKSLYLFDCTIKDGSLLSHEEGLKFVDIIYRTSILLKDITAQLLALENFEFSSLLVDLSNNLKLLIEFLKNHSYGKIKVLTDTLDLVQALIIQFDSSDSNLMAKKLLESDLLQSWYGRTQTTLLLQNI